LERHALVFKALDDDTRRAILERLKAGDLSAGEIAEGFPIGKASISHHLNLLKQAELVRVRRQGQQQIYSLHTTVFQEALQWLMTLFRDPENPAPTKGAPSSGSGRPG
jgi:DNA-binding transcriptional ArsR family regulator